MKREMALQARRDPQLLLIDDDPTMVRWLTTVLKREFEDRIEMVALAHARAALEWIERHPVDILITDMEMPRFNGLDLLVATKRRNPCAQVFFVTGHSSLDAVVKAMEHGATDYLLKPLERMEVVEIIKDAQKRFLRWQRALADALERK